MRTTPHLRAISAVQTTRMSPGIFSSNGSRTGCVALNAVLKDLQQFRPLSRQPGDQAGRCEVTDSC
jgi:hypothetical protein